MDLGGVILDLERHQLVLVAAAFIACVALEQLAPFGSDRTGRLRRWGVNLGLFAIGFALVAAISPWLFRGVAAIAAVSPFPPLVDLGLPAWLVVVLAFLVIDLTAYLVHAAFHLSPTLWRVHRVHHADIRFDASTGVRHHPIEAVAAGAMQLMVAAVLGLPLLVLIGYALVIAVWQFVTHMDTALPHRLDRLLRLVLVTPGMHRVHHSVDPADGASNFGMVLSIWDRLFGTYRRRAPADWRTLEIGLQRGAPATGLRRSLLSPFRER